MQRRFLTVGLLAVLLTAAGCFNNWAVLGPEDLPRTGESLTIESPTRLVIREGETGYLGGGIVVEEDGVLNLVVEGELSVAEEAGIENRGGRVAWTLAGVLDGTDFSLTSAAAGSMTVDAEQGSIELDNLGIFSESAGSLTWTSTDMLVNNMNFQNYGGTTRITDTGTMEVNNMYVKEQDDDTASGGLTIECNDVANTNLTAVANGCSSALTILLQGQGSWRNINVDVNYGGGVRVDTGAEAVVSIENLHVDCSGASHGRFSSAELVNAGDLAVDTFLIPDGCDCQDITEQSGPSTWLVTFPAGETFTIINTGTLDMQLPL